MRLLHIFDSISLTDRALSIIGRYLMSTLHTLHLVHAASQFSAAAIRDLVCENKLLITLKLSEDDENINRRAGLRPGDSTHSAIEEMLEARGGKLLEEGKAKESSLCVTPSTPSD